MRLQLTARNATTGACADLLIVAADSEPVAPLLDALRAAVGAEADSDLAIAGRRLHLDASVMDSGLVPGAVVVIGPATGDVPAPVHPLVGLAIRRGPAAGRWFPLRAGRYVVGRDADVDVPIDDPALSRRHAVIDVTASETVVTDLGSANGSRLNGEPLVPHVATTVGGGSAIQLGDCVIGLAPHRRIDLGQLATATITQPPRVGPLERPPVISMPVAPTPEAPPRVAVIAAALPLVAGVALSLLLHQWQFLLFTALSPLMIIGQAASDRHGVRRRNTAAQRRHATAHAAATVDLAQAVHDEAIRRDLAAPDLARLTASTAAADGEWWQRAPADPDFLRVRLGCADQASHLEVLGAATPTVADVPFVVDLAELGRLGIVGPRSHAIALARSVLVQLVTLHDPADVRLVVLAPGASHDWSFARWLPHAAPENPTCCALLGFDDRQVEQRLAELAQHPATESRRTVLVVDGRPDHRYDDLPAEIIVIWCAPTAAHLPAGCKAVATVTASPAPRVDFRSCAMTALEVRPDLLDGDTMHAVARRLTPLRSTRTAAAARIPVAVDWRDLDQLDLDRRWQGDPTMRVTLGYGHRGPIEVDLVDDGPHLLVAGTTGAGKSELLITIIAGLASRTRPDQVSFLLIDHKGGAAFGLCSRLPHTVGLMTDLDPAGTRRALVSIAAELSRREAQLATADAPDFVAYQRVGGATPLPRLVIVVDEFAALIEQQSDAVASLVAVAQRGRSLGVHVVLATQRPAGVVSAEIRANVRARICLGVTHDQDSRDVIDSPVAATISRATPGRAYLRLGAGDLQEFQSARITAPAASVTMTVAGLPDLAVGDPLQLTTNDGAPSMLDELVAAATELSERLGCVPARRPWLPPLATYLMLSELPIVPNAAVWGLVDEPSSGAQPPLTVGLGTGLVTVVAGAAGSGRSTAAVTLAVAMASMRSPDELHLWGIDGGAALQPLEALPHCGAVIAAADHERVFRLLDQLRREVDGRRQALPGNTLPPLRLLVVDGVATLPEVAVAELQRLATDGPSTNLHLVLTGDRSLLTSRLASVAGQKIALRLTDPDDYLLVGVSRRDLPTDLPPGRGVRAGDGAMVQLATADRDKIDAAAAMPPGAGPPEPFTSLPALIRLSVLPRAPGAVTVGLDGNAMTPIVLSRPDVSPAFLVCGQRGSGRTAALQLLAAQSGARRVISLGDRRSPSLGGNVIALCHDDPEHAREVIDAICQQDAEQPDVLIDDVERLADGPLAAVIEELIRTAASTGAIVGLSTTTDQAAAAFRGPVAAARRVGHGVLLNPRSRRDGEILGIDLVRAPTRDGPPGRGWLVIDGRASRIQLALPPIADAHPSTELELSAFGRRNRE